MIRCLLLTSSRKLEDKGYTGAGDVKFGAARPVPLNHDLRVVLNVPSGSPVAREMCIAAGKQY